jgi:hypothetical protein
VSAYQDPGDGSQGHRRANTAWDMVGAWLGAAGQITESIGRRNLDVWTKVSAKLRAGGYGRDEFGSDAEEVAMTLMRNLQDLRSLATNPQRRNVATPLPTVFLLFEPHGDREPTPPETRWTYIPPDGVWIPVAADADPPAETRIALGGGPSREAADQVKACLVVEPPTARGYYVGAVEPGRLSEGTYHGVVYTIERLQPIAELRVLVLSGS